MLEPIKTLLFIAIATVASVWIVDRYWNCFFERKRISLPFFFAWFLYCAFQVFILYDRLTALQPVHSPFTLIVNTLLLFLLVVFGYESAGRTKYFLFVLFCIVWSLIEMSLELFLTPFQLDWYANMIIGTASSTLLMMACSHTASLLWNRKYSEITPPSKLYFPLLLIPLGSVYIIIMQYTRKNSYLISSIVLSILLLFNLLIFQIYLKINQYFLRERENSIHAEQLSLISQNMEEQKKLMEEFYRERHDLINELTALRGEMSLDGSASAIQNLDRIIDNCHGMGSICSSGNAVIDALVNAKYATAQSYGISFCLHVCVPEDLSVAACDLGIVIGNALDNAVTAVRKCRFAQKTIQISMGVRKNAFVMVIKYPYEHTLRKNRRGELISSKPDVKNHGYGLRSIRRIAESYAGDVIIDTDNDCFVLTAVLNFSNF